MKRFHRAGPKTLPAANIAAASSSINLVNSVNSINPINSCGPFQCIHFALLLVTSFSLNAAPRSAQWQEVQDAINKGRPKTAITNLEPIIQGALRDKAYAEAVKAIGKKIVLEGTVQGNKAEEKITRLEAEIAKAPPQMKPVLETLLALWYWQ